MRSQAHGWSHRAAHQMRQSQAVSAAAGSCTHSLSSEAGTDGPLAIRPPTRGSQEGPMVRVGRDSHACWGSNTTSEIHLLGHQPCSLTFLFFSLHALPFLFPLLPASVSTLVLQSSVQGLHSWLSCPEEMHSNFFFLKKNLFNCYLLKKRKEYHHYTSSMYS